MVNSAYEKAVTDLSKLIGSVEPLESGNGCRVRGGGGSVTVYHRDVADGNLVEVAFDVASFCTSTEMNEAGFLDFLAELRAVTNRPVKVNARYKWPRVGCGTVEEVDGVIELLRARLSVA